MRKIFTILFLMIGISLFGQNLNLTSNTELQAGNYEYQNVNFNGYTLTLKSGANIKVNNFNSGVVTAQGYNIIQITNNFNGGVVFNMLGNVCIRVNNHINGGTFIGTGTNNYVNAGNSIQNNPTFNNVIATANTTTICGNVCNSQTTYNGTAWSNGAPDANKNVVYSAGSTTITTNTFACSVIVKAGATVTVPSDFDYTITNNLVIENGGNFIVESGGNLVQLGNLTNTNGGSANIKRKSNPLFRLDYTSWSSPVSGSQTLQQFSPLTLSNRFYTYNTTSNAYTPMDATSLFITGKGYLIRVPNNFPTASSDLSTRQVFNGEFIGTPNNGNINLPINYIDATHGYNLVGNPYPSNIKFSEFMSQNSGLIEGTIWLWRKTNNPDNTSYATINNLGCILNAATGGDNVTGNTGVLINNVNNYEINTGQGFFIKAKQSGNLVFKNSMRGSTQGNAFFRTANNQSSRYWLNLTSESGLFSQILVGYTSATTNAYDDGWDGTAMMDGNVTLFTWIEGYDLAIQARPSFTTSDIVNLGYDTEAASSYSISIDHLDGEFEGDQPIYIKDDVLGITHNLKDGPYNFVSEGGVYKDRFSIVYEILSLGNHNLTDKKTVAVSQKGGTLDIVAGNNINTVKIYDLSGRLLYNKNSVAATELITQELSIIQQVIVVQLTLEDGNVINKKLLFE